MSPGITIAIISASAAIFGSALTFYLSKRHEIKTEWRKRKLDRYTSLLSALSETVGENIPDEAIAGFATEFNTISLFCSTEVLTELNRFHEITSSHQPRNADWLKQHDEQLARLLLTMREDIGLSPKSHFGQDFKPKLMAKTRKRH